MDTRRICRECGRKWDVFYENPPQDFVCPTCAALARTYRVARACLPVAHVHSCNDFTTEPVPNV